MASGPLAGRVAIVTGGSRGIGRAIVRSLGALGARVVFTYLAHVDAARAVCDEVKRSGGEASAVRSDARSYQSCRAAVEEALKLDGRVDILVNNAGIVKDKALMMMDPDEWREVIETNLTGYFNMAKACIVSMLKQKSGSIINISSVAGVVGLPRQANYSSAKAGILGLTKSLAKEVGPYGIRVNAVAPGYIETDMTKELKDKERLLRLVPQGRFGDPAEVAACVSFLAADAAAYITGQVIRVDGGLAM